MISLRDVVTGFGNRDPLSEVWRRDLRGGSAEITGSLPLRYIGNGMPLTNYLISGNTVQDGTPSLQVPVDVVGCGVWGEAQQSFKLPLTVNGTEYPISLGQVESTRRIKKLVLTGGETITKAASNPVFTLQLGPATGGAPNSENAITTLSTHYLSQSNTPGTGNVGDMCICIRRGYSTMYIGDTRYDNVDDFKSYLAAQYAAGTPVTVWYVLAEPVTDIVNEPLHKIGNYADTISFTQAGVTIPTVSGANVLDMTSPVKPSEVYIKGKGIKPTGYGQLVDKNGVRILDKNNVRILVHGQ